jgi:F-type H+-transporting ATPase subunit b
MLSTPDIGFAIQIVTFLLLWVVLRRWLFEPTMGVLQLRRRQMEEPLGHADRLRGEVAELRRQYEARLEAARDAARRDIDDIRRQVEAEEAETLGAARAEAARVVEEARVTIAREIEIARTTMARYAAELSVEAAEKVLGRAVR